MFCVYPISETLCLCGVPKEESMSSSGERTEHIEGACCERILNLANKNCDITVDTQLTNGDVDDGRASKRKSSTASDVKATTWKPVLLVIPLRLGLTEINPMYINSLKVSNIVVKYICVQFIRSSFTVTTCTPKSGLHL